MTKNITNNKNNEAISAAIDLLVSKDVDLSNVLSEGGLLKQLTKRLVEKALRDFPSICVNSIIGT